MFQNSNERTEIKEEVESGSENGQPQPPSNRYCNDSGLVAGKRIKIEEDDDAVPRPKQAKLTTKPVIQFVNIESFNTNTIDMIQLVTEQSHNVKSTDSNERPTITEEVESDTENGQPQPSIKDGALVVGKLIKTEEIEED